VGDARVIEYEYDGLYRLVDADYSSGERFEYAYDAVGNRTAYTATITQTTVTTYTYDAADRLVKLGDVDYTWDDVGRLVDDGTYTYTWDAAGRLITVTDGVDTLGFCYDGDGNRLARTVNGTLTTHTLDVGLSLPEVLMEHGDDGATWYLHLPNGVATHDGTAWTYSAADGLGSVRQQLDGSGQVVGVESYRPFGSPLEGDGGAPYGYTGEWWEDVAGLLYLRARYYEPNTGRFLSLDPWPGTIWQPGTLNKYNYVGGNPIGSVDPSGRQSECPSHHNTTSRCHPPEPVWPPYDPLPPHLWSLSKEKARLFQIPVELVAGTIATEIVHDTDWHDPVLDDLLAGALGAYNCPRGITWGLNVSSYFWGTFLSGYEHYWGFAGGRGPGPGVANVHVGTAKDTEEYFATHYPNQHLLDPPPDIYARLAELLHDDTNVHYTAAILRRLANLRKGKNGEPSNRPHLHDLDEADMQIIYGAFRAGIDSYGSVRDYQNVTFPGKFGKQIALYLSFYRDKLTIERVLDKVSKAPDTP